MRARRLLVVVLPAVVACGGAAFEAGSGDGGGVDAGGDVLVESGHDGATGDDGGPKGDALPPSDAPHGEAAPPIDAGPRFCTGPGAGHTFCDDFDDRPPGAVKGAWDDLLTSSGAVLTLDGQTSVSPPQALLAQLPAPSGTSSNVVAGLRKGFGAVPSSIEFAFDVQVDAYPASGGGGVGIAVVDVGPLAYSLVAIDATHANFQESFQTAPDAQGMPVVHDIAGGLPAGAWGRVDCTITYAANTNPGHVVITFTMGQTPVKVLDESLQNVSALPGTATRLRIGVGQKTATSAWSVHFDDVTVDTH